MARYSDDSGYDGRRFDEGGFLYQSDGFEWSTAGTYWDCARDGRFFTNHSPDFSNYTYVECANDIAIARSDGESFDLQQADVRATPGIFKTPDTASPAPAGIDFFDDGGGVQDGEDLLSSEYAHYADQFYSSGLAEDSPEGEALLQELFDQFETDRRAYINWRNSSETIEDHFFITGYRDGIEIASQAFATTDGRIDLTLERFEDIDTVVFGSFGDVDHPYLFDGINDAPYDGEVVYGSGIDFCLTDCGFLEVFGFDYTLNDGDIVAPVPLPASLPMLLGAIGLFGFYGRKRRG